MSLEPELADPSTLKGFTYLDSMIPHYDLPNSSFWGAQGHPLRPREVHPNTILYKMGVGQRGIHSKSLTLEGMNVVLWESMGIRGESI